MVKHVVSTILLALVVFAFGFVRADDAHMMTKEQLLSPVGEIRCNHH